MPKKPKLTKKDAYILLLGIFLGFMLQVAYDVAREIFFSEINWLWMLIQVCYILFSYFVAFLIMRQLEQE
jgi:L-cystine uptake protein TcyP (sodium:dicarboxylate symporter family)